MKKVFTLAVCAAAGLAHAGAPLDLIMLQGTRPIQIARNTSECCTSSAHLQEVLSLSELPLDRLLRVKVAMHPRDRLGEPAVEEAEEVLPQAEALKSRKRIGDKNRRPNLQRSVVDGYDNGSGVRQSKLATGFQLAITVLSFLAFGAYLISLVVSIVRNQNSTSTTATTQTPFVLIPAQSGKRKRKRRSDPPEWLPPSLPNPDHIFDAITKAAQTYARFEGHELEL